MRYIISLLFLYKQRVLIVQPFLSFSLVFRELFLKSTCDTRKFRSISIWPYNREWWNGTHRLSNNSTNCVIIRMKTKLAEATKSIQCIVTDYLEIKTEKCFVQCNQIRVFLLFISAIMINKANKLSVNRNCSLAFSWVVLFVVGMVDLINTLSRGSIR